MEKVFRSGKDPEMRVLSYGTPYGYHEFITLEVTSGPAQSLCGTEAGNHVMSFNKIIGVAVGFPLADKSAVAINRALRSTTSVHDTLGISL